MWLPRSHAEAWERGFEFRGSLNEPISGARYNSGPGAPATRIRGSRQWTNLSG